MQLTDFLEEMDPQIYQTLKQSLELGRWPSGEKMTREQRDASLQAIIVYEHQNVPESDRVGYMPQMCKSAKTSEQSSDRDSGEDTILRFKDA
ncbi:hypothetical protein ACH42_14580 [Endozoicomonas sp. (ex Bugula neritina AB1)]|nr:hypothetical protein ACH42_14580 [Endozoicomonas sp. (ex Bugula neritina AB1)]